MISEELQDQAALHALGLLDADEAAAFERALAAEGNGELRALAADLREAVASLARTETNAAPPAGLKARVLARIAEETRTDPAKGKVIAGPGYRASWQPWVVAAAAAVVVCCASLGAGMYNLRQRVRTLHEREATQRSRAERAEHELAANVARPTPDAVGRIVYCALDPVPAPAGPQAAVLWDAAGRRGRLQIQKLPPPGSGKDYQLWTLEEGHKNPISAGVVSLNADGDAAVDFRPGEGDDARAAVTAFALSVERAGGVAQNEGPILFVGKLSR